MYLCDGCNPSSGNKEIKELLQGSKFVITFPESLLNFVGVETLGKPGGIVLDESVEVLHDSFLGSTVSLKTPG